MKECVNLRRWHKRNVGTKCGRRLRLVLEELESRLAPSGMTFDVTNTNDNGAGSLRQAILDSNAFAATAASPNIIDFFITDSGTVQTINVGDNSGGGATLNMALPAIVQPVVIDGYSEPGASANTATTGDNASILIELNGVNVALAAPDTTNPSLSGLDIAASNVTVRGLSIVSFSGNGILLEGASNGANAITGNYLGTDPTGAAAGLGNGSNGVLIQSTSGNTIGGATPDARNIISGNTGDGTLIQDAEGNADFNLIQGNYIGTDATGTVGLANGTQPGTTAAAVNGTGGVYLDGSAGIGAYEVHGNTIGGAAGAGNLISGNATDGVQIFSISGSVAADNLVQGNLIGTDVTGNHAILSTVAGKNITGNGRDGVHIEGASGNTVGIGNVISGNSIDGVHIVGTLTNPAQDNIVLANFIGTNAAGTGSVGTRAASLTYHPAPNTPDGNVLFGIEVSGGLENTIGGAGPGQGNVVGFNLDGIELDNGAQQNVVQGNFVGVALGGVTAIGNVQHGIALRSDSSLTAPLGPGQANEPGVQNNLIGGIGPGQGNIVANNGSGGVAVFGNPVALNGDQNSGNSIEGNSIFLNGRKSTTPPLLGIDLSNGFVYPKDDGFTTNNSKGHGAANDPNNFQNFPVLSSATFTNGGTNIQGSLNEPGEHNTTFRIELFASNSDPLNLPAEGQFFLGFVNVTTNANGVASFNTTVPFTVGSGQRVTATATNTSPDPLAPAGQPSVGNTSEFSPGILATRAPSWQFFSPGPTPKYSLTLNPPAPTPVPLPSPADALVAPEVRGGLNPSFSDLGSLYVFRSPTDAFNPPPANFGNTVIIVTVSPFAGALTPASFNPNLTVDINIENTGGTIQNLKLAATFGSPTPTGGGNFSQVVTLNLNGTTITTFTYLSNQQVPPGSGPGVNNPPSTISPLPGGGTGRFIAGLFDDPNFFDAQGFTNFAQTGLNAANSGAPFPRPAAANQAKPLPTNAKNSYANANVLALIMEVPTMSLLKNQSTANPNIGVWADSRISGTPVDRLGRPLINTLLIPPVPRNNLSLGDRRTAFDVGIPRNDTRDFSAGMLAVLESHNFIYQRTSADAAALAGVFLPDILTVDLSKPFFDTSGNPTPGFLNGRKLSDDVASIELNLLTNGKVPTDNVADDNAGIISDGVTRRNVATGMNQTVPAAFPYIGRPNKPPSAPNP